MTDEVKKLQKNLLLHVREPIIEVSKPEVVEMLVLEYRDKI